jgi:pyruvate formate lyase activating enzyme
MIQKKDTQIKEALLYERLAHDHVRCNLCAHHCVIADGKLGVCKVRKNVDGKLYTMVYNHTISQHVDPIEKKPLYHFYPGSTAFSIATPGCNFHCEWCQNWDIAQMSGEEGQLFGYDSTPKQIISSAQETGSHSIAYTYTEPTIFFEYTYDIARLAHETGMANIYVTNGYMTTEALTLISPYLDAANVDLKSFRDKTYLRYVGGKLEPILENLKHMKQLGIWLEVTTLVIPTINDDINELRDIAWFIAQDLGPETPWHISRFFPYYQMMNLLPTSITTLRKAMEIGLDAGLHYVYLGNVDGNSITICNNCGFELIKRRGVVLDEYHIQDGCCPHCGAPVAGVWE